MFKSYDDSSRMLISSMLGSILGLISAGVLLPLLAFLLCSTDDPAAYIIPLSFGTLLFSSTAAGVISSRLSEKLLSSLFSGITLLVTVIAVSIIVPGKPQTVPIISGIMFASIPACSCLGGYISITLMKKKDRKSRRRKRM